MKKIDLTNYEVLMLKENGKFEPESFKVKEACANILFLPALKLNGVNLLKANKLAKKILDCEKDFIILEDEEYNLLFNAVNSITGLGKSDVQFVEKIINAKDFDPNKEAQ